MIVTALWVLAGALPAEAGITLRAKWKHGRRYSPWAGLFTRLILAVLLGFWASPFWAVVIGLLTPPAAVTLARLRIWRTGSGSRLTYSLAAHLPPSAPAGAARDPLGCLGFTAAGLGLPLFAAAVLASPWTSPAPLRVLAIEALAAWLLLLAGAAWFLTALRKVD
jgi:hypothetical protein